MNLSIFNNKHVGVFDTAEESSEAYNSVKKAHIKELAHKWKDKINSKVFEALLNLK